MIGTIHFILQAIIFVVSILLLFTIVIVAKKQIDIKEYLLPFFLNSFFISLYLVIAYRFYLFIIAGNGLVISWPTLIFALIHPTLINILCYSVHFKPRKNNKQFLKRGYIISCLYGQLLALAIVSGIIII